MGVEATTFSSYPICDTDVWVKLCLGDILKELFSVHKKIVVSDVVESEILKWRNNPLFSNIAAEFEKYKQSGYILVIYHDLHIEDDDKRLLERTLFDLGFRSDFANKPPESDKGEFVSAIYANHFGIPFMKSDDHSFQEGGMGRNEFPNLIIKNWNDTLRDLIKDDPQRIAITAKVEKESKQMNRQKKQYNLQRKQDEEKALEMKLEQLLEKYGRKY